MQNNVVAARVPATDSCQRIACRVTGVTWLDAAGRTVRTYTAAAALGPGPQPVPFPGLKP